MNFFRAIAAFFYNIALRIRHFMFDAKIIKREKFDIPVVCIGNITVGGTGKTPMIEFLIPRLGAKYTVAVLSRGYGRRTKGYIEVRTDSSFLDVGDEPKQIKRKFPDTVVVVCEDRREGIRRIREEHPGVGMILMDDGFQHKRVEPALNIVLVDYTRPIYEDHLLPWGRLRDLRSQMPRAGIVVVTRTPKGLSPIERRIAEKSLKLYPYQGLFFTGTEQEKLKPQFPDSPRLRTPKKEAVLLAGIGNPEPLVAALAEKFVIREKFLFPDHHIYKVRELNEIAGKIAELSDDTVIITTEKDAVKLTNRRKVPQAIQERLYVSPVRTTFPEGNEKAFIQRILSDIKQSS